MIILLIDLDSKIPNIALMKLSTYHKEMGDSVEFMRFGLKAYPHKKKVDIPTWMYDKVYISNIFTENQNKFNLIGGDKNVEIGGVGSINPYKALPLEVEKCDLDYSLYPDNDTNYGFITKGCIRKCSFCAVPKTEGKLHFNKNIDEIIKYGFTKTSFMDNNILAYKKHKEILQELINKRIKCVFNQGLDIRLIDEENAYLLSKLKYIGKYTFAFDNPKDKPIIEKKLKIVKKYIKAEWGIRFYIYHNHKTMDKKNLYMRLDWCKENYVLPYMMRDRNCYGIKEYTQLARWVNQPQLFCKTTFEEFQKKDIEYNSKKDMRF